MARKPVPSIFAPEIVGPAALDAVKKLDPRWLARNPVIFVTAVAALLATIFFVRDIAQRGDAFFSGQIAVWLWLTVLFANFAEAVAEGRGKAQAASLRKTRTETIAKKIASLESRASQQVAAPDLKIGDLVLCDGSVLAHSQGGWLDVDLYLMKFDAAGALLWARNLELTQPGVGTIGALAIDPDGSLWYATTDFVLTRINKVDADGNDVESRYIDGGKSIGGMSFDQAGGLYVSGSCDGNAFAFGGINPPLPVNEPYLMYLARFKPDGTGDWARFAHDITFKHPMVVADGQGHAYLAGELMDSTSWGGVLFNGPDWGTSTFLAKVDSSGQFLWGIESDPPGGAIDGDLAAAAGACVALDGAGRPYITGTLRGLVDWGGGVVSDGGEMTTRTQTIVAFDTDGTPLWATSSAPTSTFLNAMAITAMNDGTLHFSAHVNGPYEFPPLSINEGGGQAYTLGRISSTSTGIIAHGQDDAHFAYPSPFSSGFSIMPRPSGTALLRAFDAEGRLLYQGGYHEPLGAGWPSGLYTVEVNGSGTRRSFRVVKE